MTTYNRSDDAKSPELSSIGAVILAGGRSRRFAQNKLLYEIDGIPLIRKTLEPFMNTLNTVIVVTGAFTESLKSLLDECRVVQIHNPRHEEGGMSSSVRTGIQFILNNHPVIEGLFIHPADIPLITKEDLSDIIHFQRDCNSKIVIPVYREKEEDLLKGHPLFIQRSLFSELLRISERDQGLRGFLKDHDHLVKYRESHNRGILIDIDRLDDLDKLKYN